MEAVAVLMILALLVEAVVETVKQAVTGGVKWPAVAAMAGGVGVCIASGVGIFGVLGISFPAWLDAVVTGILVSRGSNFISDLFGRINGAK
ncbi:MAG TPA: hypothetical protein VN462_09205 [Negativicutes bacterium]|nr:hypothetical protein [Negativicutes bacterium]